MYAIVDIETTGGYAANNAITEVAIVLHDGKQEVRRLETLVNPGMPIPRYVQSLTGITDEMVASAPSFTDLAPQLFEWLEGAVFVAHNVNFDYSFLKHQFQACDLHLDSPKLCTVRLSRKVFPGCPSYSLGKLCDFLAIPIPNRHRAGGDATATTLLFEKALRAGALPLIEAMLKGKNKEQYLPPNLPATQLDQLPPVPGVYYFHDGKGKVIYVGKAKNLRKRVGSHFSNNKPNRQKQAFLQHIHSITHQVCGTELMAFLLECIEIRRLWPAYNRSLKRFEQTYGLYVFEDRNGYTRLVIEKRKKQLSPVYTFSLLVEGNRLLWKLVKQWKLCPKLCFLQTNDGPCEGIRQGFCDGACQHSRQAGTGPDSAHTAPAVPSGSADAPHVLNIPDPVQAYNLRVRNAIQSLSDALPSFTVFDQGRHPGERSCILMEQGRFYGMGYLPAEHAVVMSPAPGRLSGAPQVSPEEALNAPEESSKASREALKISQETLKAFLTPYPENDYMRGLVYQHVEKWPTKRTDLRSLILPAARPASP